jgi:hypothetical protein
MPTTRVRVALGLVLLAASAWTSLALASERSELLVARGEVAYHAGQLEEARSRFQAALAADPNDEIARAWLGVLAAGVPREPSRGERTEAAARSWDLEAGTGVSYDSNPGLDPHDARGDAAFLFTLAGHVDGWRDDRTLVRLDYDFWQSLHTVIDDFDVRANQFRATVSRAVMPGLWLGLQGGWSHTTLHTHAYLQEPWAMPYVSYVEGDRGATQIAYRYGNEGYLGTPFGGSPYDRDGSLRTIGLTQLLFFFDRRLATTLGYAYEEETPYKASGNDFARHTQQGSLGLRFPAWWRTLVELDYVYRYDDYTKLNSAADFRKTRQDDGSYISTYVRRPIIPHLDAMLSYFVTVNGSNIPLYDYGRQVVALELRYSF